MLLIIATNLVFLPLMETLFTGRNIIRLTKVASTNNYASQLLRSVSVIEGTLITAFEQTEGRGQREKKWFSEPGKNLTCSVVLRPSFLTIDRQYLLNKCIASAVCKTINLLLGEEKAKIKWPNDILVGNFKMAGILIENALSGGHIVSCVAGIGLNVNQDSFPEDLPNAVSLKMISGVSKELEDVEAVLCKEIEAGYLKLKAGNFDQIRNSYDKALWKRGENVSFTNNDFPASGEIVGVDDSGMLIMRNNNKTDLYKHGEIVFVI